MNDEVRRFLANGRAAVRRFNSLISAIACAVLIACASCSSLGGGAGIILPAGDIERGKAAFRELKCHTCHSVSGHDFPHPVVWPPVLVVLGTEDCAPSRRELINSIINPSHGIFPAIDRRLVQTNGISRMTEFSDVLTVRQLSDLVAFLETLHR